MTFKMLRKRGDEMFSALIANSTDGIYIISLGGIEYANPAFEALVGRTAEEICARGFDFLDLVHPEDRALVAGAKGPLYEYRMIDGEAGIRFVEANASALPGGRPDAGHPEGDDGPAPGRAGPPGERGEVPPARRAGDRRHRHRPGLPVQVHQSPGGRARRVHPGRAHRRALQPLPGHRGPGVPREHVQPGPG